MTDTVLRTAVDSSSPGEVRARVVVFLNLLLLVASVAAFSGDWFWWGDMLAHGRLQLLIASLLATALAAWPRTRLGISVALLALLLNGYPIGTNWFPLRPAPKPLPASASRLTYLGLNLDCRNPDLGAVIPLIEREVPELLVLTEYTPRAQEMMRSFRGANPGALPHEIERAREGAFGIAVFSRYPITDSRVLALGENYPLALRVTLKETAVGEIDVLAIHPVPPFTPALAHRQEDQLDRLAKAITGIRPQILAGDFNLTPYAVRFRRLLASGDMLDSAHHHGHRPTYRGRGGLFQLPIDHLAHGREFVTTERRVVDIPGSDHHGLACTLGRTKD